jgi:hypothetical protein
LLRGLGALVCLGAGWGALADGAPADGAPGSCEREAAWVHSDQTRHYLVLAASRGVFYDRSGPSIVMLMKADAAADEVEMGAVGIHADEKGRAVFGTVPWRSYDALLREPKKGSQNVLLRLEINQPQYERVLGVLRNWEKRARENALLYPNDFNMNNILLVKQATEELNRCSERVNLYKLDWGLEDRISDENARSHVAFLVFEDLKRRNAALHVPDETLPEGLLGLAGSEPLAARELPREQLPGKAAARGKTTGHEHHAGH